MFHTIGLAAVLHINRSWRAIMTSKY